MTTICACPVTHCRLATASTAKSGSRLTLPCPCCSLPPCRPSPHSPQVCPLPLLVTAQTCPVCAGCDFVILPVTFANDNNMHLPCYSLPSCNCFHCQVREQAYIALPLLFTATVQAFPAQPSALPSGPVGYCPNILCTGRLWKSACDHYLS